MFGTTNNCEYSPLVKYGAKGPYIKVKLETDFASDAIETVVWLSEKTKTRRFRITKKSK